MVIYYWRNRIVAIAPVLKTGTQQWVRGFESHFLRHALVVQRIEHRFSKPRIEVRFLSRAPSSNPFSKSLMCHARSAWWLETESYARIVPPPPRFSRQPQKEKMFLAFRICARSIFSKNGKDIFLWCSALKVSGRWRNNADEVLAKLFFGEERICQNFDSFVFEFGCRKWKRRGLGRNFLFAPLFSFGEIRAGFLAGPLRKE